ncbi:MAG: hypothetical protein QOJ59_3436 [Thermomicrobiales bacterium]|nr:hypothetical protein [Thermomicrobiales bacterium]
MDSQRFDDITRLLASRATRRVAIKTLAAAVGASVLARVGTGGLLAQQGPAKCRRSRDCPIAESYCETTSGLCCDVDRRRTACCREDQVASQTSTSQEGNYYQCCPGGSDPVALGSNPGRPRCCAAGTTCRAADKCCKPDQVCAHADGEGKGRCCPTGSASDLCDGKCCANNGICASDGGRKQCCPAGSHTELVAGKCCPGDRVVATGSDGSKRCCPAGSKTQLADGRCCPNDHVLAFGHGGREACCPAGSKDRLVNGKCCADENVAASDGSREICCPPDSSSTLCARRCCPADRVCCNGKCCPTGQDCNEDGTCSPCPDGSHVCGDGCCPDGRRCCQHVCCAEGATCDGPGGTCGSDCGERFTVFLSGSSTGASSFSVDDNIDVFVDGVRLINTNDLAGSRGPFEFTVAQGSSFRVVGRDTFGFCASIDPLYLYRPCDGASQTIDAAGLNLGCGRPSGDQGAFYDKTVTVAFD